MVGFRSKFIAYHRYFNQAAEDLFSVTLGFPFTYVLFYANRLSDQFIDVPSVPFKYPRALWNLFRITLTLPSKLFVGLISLSLSPLLAASFSFSAINNESDLPKYTFPLGHWFERTMHGFFLRFIIDFRFPNLPGALKYLFLYGFFGYLALAFSPFAAYTPIAGMVMTLDFLLSGMLPMLPYMALSANFIASLPILTAATFALVGLGLTLEANYNVIGQWMINGYYKMYDMLVAKNWIKVDFSKVKNQEEVASLDNVVDIAKEDLFITDSGYAFDISGMLQGLQIYGFTNFQSRDQEAFTEDDVWRIINHPNIHQYPELKQFCLQQQANRVNRDMSPETLRILKDFAIVMGKPQEQNDFAEKFSVAKEAFEQHRATLSAEARAKLDNINLLGGVDQEYQLSNVLNKVYTGVFCKKGASNLIIEMTRNYEFAASHNQQWINNSVFWQRETPTHFLGLHLRP